MAGESAESREAQEADADVGTGTLDDERKRAAKAAYTTLAYFLQCVLAGASGKEFLNQFIEDWIAEGPLDFIVSYQNGEVSFGYFPAGEANEETDVSSTGAPVEDTQDS